MNSNTSGILLVNKPKNKTSFSLVAALRRHLGIRKIGHAGTLDPFATGLMVMLIGREATKLSDRFLTMDKCYRAKVYLGVATDTYDCDGKTTFTSPLVPSLSDVNEALQQFQGKVTQIPPMFSAKKQNGKKLYELARKGIEVERKPVVLTLEIELLSYAYPCIELAVKCSKGTYIRSLAHDLGKALQSGAHLVELQRTRSGSFHLEDSLNGDLLFDAAKMDLELLKSHMLSYASHVDS